MGLGETLIATDLVGHLESHLGEMSGGSRFSGESFQIAIFDDSPFPLTTTYATLGLSHHVFELPTGHRVRQELVLSCGEQFRILNPEGPIAAVAADAISAHKPINRGQVIGPAGPLWRASSLEAFFCTYPAFFPPEFHVWSGSDPETVFVWLIPITHAEAHFVFNNGWKAFEDHLQQSDIAFLDLRRESSL